VIAKVRHSTPGVGLISPPPHHDIYSIEDLAQLIFDLKNVNPAADISVKLVSEVGVGTVAAGVAKARADHITISGYEGGTGASPLTSLKHAGSPWEIGLAETHQTLVLNGLRSRIALQVDGGLRTGRDVIIGALLGADEFGFSTAPLIAAGCIMMRKCHLNTCPVGVATQDPVLRKRFKGTPEHVINYFFFVAEEVRELLAAMGYRKLDDHHRPVRLLDKDALIDTGRPRGSISPASSTSRTPRRRDLLDRAAEASDRRCARPQADRAGGAGAGKQADAVRSTPIHQECRPLGRRHAVGRSRQALRPQGPAGRHHSVKLTGTAGQSFGAFLANGVTFDLSATATTMSARVFAAAASSCGRRKTRQIVPEKSIIVGNTVLYGAIQGECYFRGVAGERFAVRNSGAAAVVEGVRRPWLRIHDRRRDRRARRDRPQLRGRHVGRRRLCARRGRLSPAAATWPWSSWSRCPKKTISWKSCTTMAAIWRTRGVWTCPAT
jgi:glutamate synthase (NADPH/NADH) large chain